MIVRNAEIFGEDGRFARGDLAFADGLVAEISTDGEEIDGSGCYLLPGLIDMHFHGCLGADVCDGTEEALRTIAGYEAQNGITAICPATLTLSKERLLEVISVMRRFRDSGSDGADLVGINMEGPFISRAKRGAQNPAFIRDADEGLARRFLEAGDGLVKVIGVAPEASESALSFIDAMKDEVRISLAHTDADYETAKAAIEHGASHAVHLFNAMHEMSHTEPGTVGAVLDSGEVCAELIADGVHVHPVSVRLAFRELPEDRVILISDSLRATGMPDGVYDLGGQAVVKRGRRCTLQKEGNLAGSVSNLYECMVRAVKEMGIPLERAVRAASINPARQLSIDQDYGSLSVGKKGNALLADRDLRLLAVIRNGKIYADYRQSDDRQAKQA